MDGIERPRRFTRLLTPRIASTLSAALLTWVGIFRDWGQEIGDSAAILCHDFRARATTWRRAGFEAVSPPRGPRDALPPCGARAPAPPLRGCDPALAADASPLKLRPPSGFAYLDAVANRQEQTPQ